MGMLTFNAIDVETANADRASICQIGIAHVRDGQIAEHWQTLINPEDWFDPWNTSIHGIDESDVEESPALPEVRDELRRRLRGSILVSHTSFDRVAFERAMQRYDLEQLRVTWLDSAKIVRRAWPEKFARRGWGLKNVASELGISFQHHNALEDARAAAQIVLRACRERRIGIEEWLSEVNSPIFTTTERKAEARKGALQQSERRAANPLGPLYGECIVFTGQISIPRPEAADMAAHAGCSVKTGVSGKTTLLVVGVQNMDRLAGYGKSTKHRKAEALIDQGKSIRILSEQDFKALVALAAE